jgi:hypothetical protein
LLGWLLAALLVFGVLGSVGDDRLDFPLVSPLVCSVRGGDWYGGGLLGAPGCYPMPPP